MSPSTVTVLLWLSVPLNLVLFTALVVSVTKMRMAKEDVIAREAELERINRKRWEMGL